MTEAGARRRPSPRLVLWGSVALFAALFTLLTLQLSRGAAAGGATAARPGAVRKVIVRRVVTTVVPAEEAPEAETEAGAGGYAVESTPVAPAPEPVEPVITGSS